MKSLILSVFLLFAFFAKADAEIPQYYCVMKRNVLSYPNHESSNGKLWTFSFEADWGEVRFKPGGYFDDMIYEVTKLTADKIEEKYGNSIFIYYKGKYFSTLTSHLFVSTTSGDCKRVSTQSNVSLKRN